MLLPEVDGENVIYQLRVLLDLSAELQNFDLGSGITSGLDPFAGPFMLGNAASQLELGASFSLAGYVMDYGTTVTLTAEPNPGWSFNRWDGDLNTMDNPVTLFMDSNKSVTAVFQEDLGPRARAMPWIPLLLLDE